MALLDPATSFWAPMALAAVLGAAVLLAPRKTLVLALGSISGSLVAIALLLSAGWNWLLRDGLGPDASPTTGAVAALRFAEGFLPPLLIAIGVAAAILILCRRRLRTLMKGGLA